MNGYAIFFYAVLFGIGCVVGAYVSRTWEGSKDNGDKWLVDGFGRKTRINSKGEAGVVIDEEYMTDYDLKWRVRDKLVTWETVATTYPSHAEEAAVYLEMRKIKKEAKV